MSDDFRENAAVLLCLYRLGPISVFCKSHCLVETGDSSSVSLEDKHGKDVDETFGTRFHIADGFYHTHPARMNGLSKTDIVTARSFAFSYGKKILMVLETEAGWYGAWDVDEDGNVVPIRAFKVFDYFVCWR